MDLRQLRHFLVLTEHLHFGRTADALAISQPTLSQQMLALEADVGAKLFDRTKRSVRLTNAGRVYAKEVRDLLERLEEANKRVREAEDGIRGELVVAASGPAIISDVPRVVNAFTARFPKLTVRLRVMQSEDIAVAIRERRVQLGFARAPANDPSIVAEPLWEHPFRVILPARHPAARSSSVSLGKLAGTPLIIYPRTQIGETYHQTIALCHEQGYDPPLIEEVAGMESTLGLVACGYGVSIVVAPWQKRLHFPEVVFKPIAASSQWRFRIAACWNRDEDSTIIQAFVDQARRMRQDRTDKA